MGKYKIKFGKSSRFNSWGTIGKARGMYSGGYTYKVWGVKGIVSIEFFECWGDFRDMTFPGYQSQLKAKP
jgi:hypothetical protein